MPWRYTHTTVHQLNQVLQYYNGMSPISLIRSPLPSLSKSCLIFDKDHVICALVFNQCVYFLDTLAAIVSPSSLFKKGCTAFTEGGIKIFGHFQIPIQSQMENNLCGIIATCLLIHYGSIYSPLNCSPIAMLKHLQTHLSLKEYSYYCWFKYLQEQTNAQSKHHER